jgi:hypothetical protein
MVIQFLIVSVPDNRLPYHMYDTEQVWLHTASPSYIIISPPAQSLDQCDDSPSCDVQSIEFSPTHPEVHLITVCLATQLVAGPLEV